MAEIRLKLRSCARNSLIRSRSAGLSGHVSRAKVEGEGVIAKIYRGGLPRSAPLFSLRIPLIGAFRAKKSPAFW